MNIREFAISHYGPLRDVRYQLQPGLQLFYGPNESGKTLLLDALLKLMLGKNLKDFQNIDRVDGLPQGRVVLAHQGREHIFDGNTLLSTAVDLSSSDMRNVFVIRNKDLQMSGQADYFKRLNDQLTGMEGRRLTRLKELIRSRGALTRASTGAQLAKSQEHNWIGEKKETAANLATEIKKYVATARADQLDTLEQKLESCRYRLRQLNHLIQQQESAQKWAEYKELRRQVEEHAQLSQAANRLLPYTKTKLMQLQDKTSRSQANSDAAQESKEQLERLLPQLEQGHSELAESKVHLASLEERRLFLDNLSQQTLAASGEERTSPRPLWGRFGLALIGVSAIALLVAANGGLPQSLAGLPYWSLGGALLLLAIDTVLRLQTSGSRKRQGRLLQQGAAAGILAKTILELAAATAKERTAIDAARLRHQSRSEWVNTMENQRLYLAENIRANSILAAKLEHEVASELQRLGAKDLDHFGELMEQFNLAQAQSDDLHQDLETAFGQAPARTGDWDSLLQRIPAPTDPGLAWDSELLAQLRHQKDGCLAESEQLQESLSRHHEELNRFAAACRALPLAAKTGRVLPDRFADLEMLEHSASVLELFVDAVTATFDAALMLMGVLENIEAEEQAKTADLVGPTKAVQQIFTAITGGKYRRVKLDSKSNIVIENSAGLELPASALSQGTFDQLYLALRISLAHDLLGGNPGFLLLDDAYLCADSTRLDRMLAVLAQLAAGGWQILYFSMDQRLLSHPSLAGSIIQLRPLAPEPDYSSLGLPPIIEVNK